METPEYAFKVNKLINQEATRRNLIKELNTLFSDKPDFSLFYFAGHGFATDVGTYIGPIDTDEVDVGIDLEYLRKLIINKLEDESVAVIFLDCCHSGASHIRGLQTSFMRKIENLDIERAIPVLGRGKVVIAACKPDELAYEEPTLRHGVFTYHLLKGMYGDAADHEGEVTIMNLYDHVSKSFEKDTRQTPVFRGDIIGRLVLGQNLLPRDRAELPENLIREIEAMAQRMMNEHIQLTSTDIETWKNQSYRDACSNLLPVLDWLGKQNDKHPKLSTRPTFKSAYSTAQAKLADLARLQEGFNTREGFVQTKLGAGTFGSVWMVKTEGGGEIAYKVYHPIDLENHEKLGRFSRGYRAMEQLDHPHIVRVHKFTRCPVGFTMDYIAGPNLRDFAAIERTPYNIVRQLLTVGETLQHSHSRGVIHRDVKPENIIMLWDEKLDTHRPYLTDFDLAWFSTATIFTKEGVGSLIYAAPEQLGRSGKIIVHS